MARKPNRDQRYLDHPGDRYRYSKPVKSTHGHYMIRIYDRATGGRVKTVSTRSRAYATAERFRDQLRIEWEDKDQRQVTFGEAVDSFIESKSKTVKAVTLRDYQHVARYLEKHIDREKKLADISTAELEAVCNHKDKSHSWQHLRKTMVHGVFKHARKSNWFSGRNPAVDIEIRKNSTEPKTILTHEEAKLLIELSDKPWTQTCSGKRHNGNTTAWQQPFTPSPQLRLALCLLLQQGWRIRTCLDLRWRNISLENNSAKFDPEQMKAGREFLQPLHQDSVTLLKRELSRQGSIRPNERVLCDISTDSSVFRKTLKRLCGRAAHKIEDAVRKEQIMKVTPHALRHYYATQVAVTAPAAVLSALMDHRPTTTLQISGVYVHVPWEKMVEAQNSIPNLIGEYQRKQLKTLDSNPLS